MPKEYIYEASSATGPDAPPPRRAEVHWVKDMYAGMRIEEGGGDLVELRSLSVDLDRDGINRLIRALRKARDQAFGADA